MFEVSQEFIDKIKAGERRVWCKVQVDYTDPFLDQSIQVSTSEQTNIHEPRQVADNVSTPTRKFASLDGSWVLGEFDIYRPGDQIGWWGHQLSRGDATYLEPYPALTITHALRPIYSLKVVGDSKRAEYPVDFTVGLYAEDGTLLYTETVLGNTKITWEKTLLNPVLDIVRQVLTITKWSHPSRQVKILEFYTSVQEIYEGEDVIKINLLEEREVSQGSLPIGNISANEISIELNNESRKFDEGNSQSPLHNLIKANRKIKAWLGIEKDTKEKEWIPLGTFWSGDWSVPEDGITAKTSGRDRMELLRKSPYRSNEVELNKSLYDLAITVLHDAGLKNYEYWVDTELQNFIVPYSHFESQSHREALRKIAEACLGQAYCDRNGVIRIEGPSFTENRIAQALGIYFLDGTYPAEIEAVEAYGIGPEDYFKKDNPSKENEIANYIEVETQPLRPDVEKEVYQSNEPIAILTGQTKTITVYYNETPCIDAVASLEGTGSIVSETYYSWGATIKVFSSVDGQFTLKINAKPLKVQNKEKAIAFDEKSIADNGQIQYPYPGNPLIQTLSVAQKIADKLLQYYKDPRRDLVIEWRCNPALELGDIITVPDYQRGNTDIRGYYYITKQDIEYTGALRAKLEGKRAI